jgi:fumarate hydratase subunit alpha
MVVQEVVKMKTNLRFVVVALIAGGTMFAQSRLSIGVGVGGNFEMSAVIAKRALMRKVGQPSDDPQIAELEAELYEKCNALGLGPEALGGTQTVLAVHVETMPTHIASLPVAVNIECHAHRTGVREI